MRLHLIAFVDRGPVVSFMTSRHVRDVAVVAGQAQRIEAGLELFGTKSYRNSSVKEVCDRVGLTERYFCESFANREALLASVFDALVHELDMHLRQVVENGPRAHEARLRRLVEVFFHFIRDDRRRARVLLFEILGVNPDIDRRYQTAVRNLARLIEHPKLGLFPAAVLESAEGTRVMSIGLVGPITQIATQWVLENFRTTVAQVEESALKIFLAVSAHRRRTRPRTAVRRR